MYMSQNVCAYVTCTNIRHELYMVMSHICIFIFHRYKNTSRTAIPPDDNEMSHSNGAIYMSHICIFICHTYQNTSRTATPPHDNEMPHSHGAIYISHICIFICHKYKYTSRTANDNAMSHSNEAIYISHICIFYVTQLYTRHELLPLHMIMRCLIHMGPFVYHTYVYSMSQI